MWLIYLYSSTEDYPSASEVTLKDMGKTDLHQTTENKTRREINFDDSCSCNIHVYSRFITSFRCNQMTLDLLFWTNRGHIISPKTQIPVYAAKLAQIQFGVNAHKTMQLDSLAGGLNCTVLPMSRTEYSVIGDVYSGLNTWAPPIIPHPVAAKATKMIPAILNTLRRKKIKTNIKSTMHRH